MALHSWVLAATRGTIAALLIGLPGCGGGGDTTDPNLPGPIPAPPPSLAPPPSPQPPISIPPIPLSWEWILQSSGLPVWPPLVAFFDMDGFETPATYVSLANSMGIKTICYISVGTAERFRPDFQRLQQIPGVIGKPYPGFPDEYYLNIAKFPSFIDIIDDRLEMCDAKGFVYVEFDIIDSYADGANVTGFAITQSTAIAYISDLVMRANGYGMKTVQKNAPDLSLQLEPMFDAVLFEECVRLNFCAAAAPYVTAGKPALNAEYPSEWARGAFVKSQVCGASTKAGMITIITTLDLNLVSDPC